MSQAEINQWKEQLKRATDNEKEFNRIREALFDGLSKGETTEQGHSQHKKLQIVEKAIRENLRVKQDLEVILAVHKE